MRLMVLMVLIGAGVVGRDRLQVPQAAPEGSAGGQAWLAATELGDLDAAPHGRCGGKWGRVELL